LTRKYQEEESAIEIICRFDYYTVVPIQFAYAKSRGIDITEGLIQLLNEVVSEKMPLWISLSPLAYIQ
jgi:hypothetical protein